MSKLTVIACSHIIILTGYNQTKRKTPLTLKNRNGLGLRIIIIFLTLIFNRCEIIQYANRGVGQTHVIPQLLTLLNTQRSYGFAFNHNIPLTKEIHVVFVL